jgi:hypothetical protein
MAKWPSRRPLAFGSQSPSEATATCSSASFSAPGRAPSFSVLLPEASSSRPSTTSFGDRCSLPLPLTARSRS